MARIFLCYETSTNASVQSDTWDRNFRRTVEKMGCDVVFVAANPGRVAASTGDNDLRLEFTDHVAQVFESENTRKPFDLAFFYLMEGMFDRDRFQQIQFKDVPKTNFSCNNIHQFDLVRGISDLFDLNLFSEKEAAEKFESIGATAKWWPMASNPDYFSPRRVDSINSVASFVGARYGTRLEQIHQLLEHGIDVRANGPGWERSSPAKQIDLMTTLGKWAIARMQLGALRRTLTNRTQPPSKHRVTSTTDKYIDWQNALHTECVERYPNAFGPPVSDEQLVKLYSSSAVTLGFLEVFLNHDPTRARLKHMHLRDFEAAMCGAVYCTDYSDELAEMFEPGKEVLASRSLEEKIDFIRFYTHHPAAGTKIRDAARKRALAEHTYAKRFSDLFRHLGISR